MKFGFSSYSFHQRVGAGTMSIEEVIDWVADSSAEHLEFAVLGEGAELPIPNIDWDPARVAALRAYAADRGVLLSNLAFTANLAREDEAEQAAEIARVKKYVDLAEALGIERIRHDVAQRRTEGDDSVEFDQALALIAPAVKEIAQYAAGKGIRTSVENHGYFVQASERVRRLIHAVDEPNFGTTLDIGNFLCVDEEPTIAVAANLPYANIVHFKDFYVRTQDPGEGWFRSRGGRYLRGAIVGNGDIDTRAVIRAIKDSGYDGYASIEFEGAEDCLLGCARGIANAQRLWAEA